MVVKAYNKQYTKKFPSGYECLKNEIKGLRKLKFLKIAQLLEVHESESTIYLVFDPVNGESLAEKMNSLQSVINEQNIQILMYNLLKVLN